MHCNVTIVYYRSIEQDMPEQIFKQNEISGQITLCKSIITDTQNKKKSKNKNETGLTCTSSKYKTATKHLCLTGVGISDGKSGRVCAAEYYSRNRKI